MIQRTFGEDTLSLLGFGTMRLPVTESGAVDENQVRDMVAMRSRTASITSTRHTRIMAANRSESSGALREYPRESYRLATKYPGHQIAASYDPAAVFEDQLAKCGV